MPEQSTTAICDSEGVVVGTEMQNDKQADAKCKQASKIKDPGGEERGTRWPQVPRETDHP